MKLFDLYGEVDIRTQKLNRGLTSIRVRLKGITSSLTSLAKTGAIVFAGIAAAALLVGRSFIKAASSMEDYEIRLETLLGSQEKATKAMSFFVDVAAKVPFSLDAIAEAGVTLEAMGAKHQKWLPVLSDLAAVMGIDVKNAASALGRAYAGGAGAADIFRERGILNIIKASKGIEDLSKLTLPEFRDAMFEAFVDSAGKVAGASKRMATTWTGQLSMLGDSVFKLRKEFGTALLPAMKELVTFTIKPLVNEWVEWVKQNKEMLASGIKSFVADLTVLVDKLAKGIRFMLTNYQEWRDVFVLASLDMKMKWIDFTTTMKISWEVVTGTIAAGFLFILSTGRMVNAQLEKAFLRLQSTAASVMSKVLLPFSKKWSTAFSVASDVIIKKSEEVNTKFGTLVHDQILASLNRVQAIKKDGEKEKSIFEAIRRAYLKSMEDRKKKSLLVDKDIKKSSSETQEAITIKQKEEENKRRASLGGIVELWQETQARILEGQKGLGKGINNVINVKTGEKKSDKILDDIAKKEKEGNSYLKKMNDNIEIIKDKTGSPIAEMG